MKESGKNRQEIIYFNGTLSKMKHFIQLSLIIFLIFPAMAQQQTDESTARAKEREIKTSGNYLYGESVADTKEEAVKLAKSILVSEVNKEILTRKDWQFAKKISAKDVEYSVESIDLARGSKIRAIAFVRKDGIEVIFDKAKAPNVNLIDKKAEKALTQNGLQEFAVTVPTHEPSSTPVATPTLTTKFDEIESPQTSPIPTNNLVLDEILICKTIKEVSAVFENHKKKGKLVYGRTGTNLSSENSYMMIYNQAGEIVAFLDKGQGSTRKNLLTNEQVSPHSFNASQIWFQIFE